MLTTVRLYGALGREFGRVHRYDIAAPAEALRALRAQHRGFAAALARQPGVRLMVDDVALAVPGELLIERPMRTLRIVPAVRGAGWETGAWLANLLAVSFEASPVLYSALYVAGTAIIVAALNGVSRLLAPSLDAGDAGGRERPDNQPSYAFDGPVNTIRQGNPVPIFFGRLRVGSQVISSGLFAEDMDA